MLCQQSPKGSKWRKYLDGVKTLLNIEDRLKIKEYWMNLFDDGLILIAPMEPIYFGISAHVKRVRDAIEY